MEYAIKYVNIKVDEETNILLPKEIIKGHVEGDNFKTNKYAYNYITTNNINTKYLVGPSFTMKYMREMYDLPVGELTDQEVLELILMEAQDTIIVYKNGKYAFLDLSSLITSSKKVELYQIIDGESCLVLNQDSVNNLLTTKTINELKDKLKFMRDKICKFSTYSDKYDIEIFELADGIKSNIYMKEVFDEDDTELKDEDVTVELVPSNDVNTKDELSSNLNIKNMVTSTKETSVEGLYNYLKDNIIGHDEALKKIATILYMNYTSSPLFGTESILIPGPTGTGKTATFNCAAKYFDVPFRNINTCNLVPEGIVGTTLEDEFESLHKIGVDALILQDIGLISVVHKMFPNLEIHASTQMHNHSKENIKFLESLGVKRVVFARELPLDFINDLDTTMEKEAFIHGSLCISYSGQCYFSKCILNRSANRGECAGMCRLKYNLLEDERLVNNSDKYLLSPKDLCSVENFKNLMDSNIYSFKIEGRMKSPAYVGIVTKIYRNLIDDYESGKELKVPQTDLDELKSIFYRGYTPGFLFNNVDIMNYESSNHIGLYAGKITKVTPKKLAIKLDIDLKQGDSIRFKNINKGITLNFIYDSKDNLISNGTKGTTIYLDNFLNLTKEDEIFLTSPKLPIETNITKKINVSMNFTANLNEKIKLEVSDEINNVTVYGEPPLEAINQPITKENIEKSLTKTGTTPYKVSFLNINISDNLFIRNIDLNNLRREALEELSLKRTKVSKEFIKNNYQENLLDIPKTKEVYVLARTKEQINVLKNYPVKIIVDKLDLLEPNFIYKIPRNLLTYPKYTGKVLNTSYASMVENPGNIGDYFLNITNHFALNLAHKYNSMVTLSFENNFDELKNIMKNYPTSNTGLLIYGKIELMMMKVCLLKNTFNAKNCHICKDNKTYKLLDRNKEEYEILTSPQTHTSYILNCHTTNLIDKIPNYQELGITNFRVDLSSETAEETVNIIEQIMSKFNINN